MADKQQYTEITEQNMILCKIVFTRIVYYGMRKSVLVFLTAIKLPNTVLISVGCTWYEVITEEDYLSYVL
jgi:hypothetical protein